MYIFGNNIVRRTPGFSLSRRCRRFNLSIATTLCTNIRLMTYTKYYKFIVFAYTLLTNVQR